MVGLVLDRVLYITPTVLEITIYSTLASKLPRSSCLYFPQEVDAGMKGVHHHTRPSY